MDGGESFLAFGLHCLVSSFIKVQTVKVKVCVREIECPTTSHSKTTVFESLITCVGLHLLSPGSISLPSVQRFGESRE